MVANLVKAFNRSVKNSTYPENIMRLYNNCYYEAQGGIMTVRAKDTDEVIDIFIYTIDKFDKYTFKLIK